jgi:hypothetical protein
MAHARTAFAAFARPSAPARGSVAPRRASSAVPTRALAAAPARRGRGRGRGGGRGGGRGESGADFSAGRAIQSDLTAASDPRLILDIVANHADGFDAIHAATAMHRLATHARSQRDRESATRDARFAILLDVVTRSLRKMNSQGLANVAWACARLEHHPGEDVLREIAEGLEAELRGGVAGGGGNRRETRPQAVSNTLWAFGQLRYKPDGDTLSSLCANTTPSLKKFRAQELANAMLGLAHVEHDPGAAFFDAAMRAASDELRSFEGQETSNLLWACARLNRTPPSELIDGLLEQDAAANLGGMASPLNMSQCLWACARLDRPPPAAYLAAAEREIPRCATRLNPENVDCVLWALASLGVPLREEAMAALTAACARLHDRMDAEMLVKAHWAFARLRHRPPPGDMNRIVGAAKRLVGELPDEDRLTVMHAWGVLRVNPGDDIVSAFTESFRAGDVGDGDDEDASDADDPEARLDGASCAKLLCAYGRTRHQPPAAHAAALAARLVEEAEADTLHPSAATLGLWGASLLGLKMTAKQLDVLARDAVSQDANRLAPRSLAKIVWALAALGYDPTAADLAALRARAAAAMPRLLAKDQEALREALSRLGERDLDFALAA